MIKSSYSDVQVPEIPLHYALFAAFGAHGDKVALINGITDQKYTYNDILKSTRILGSALTKMGAKKGDILAMFLPNMPEFVLMYFSGMAIGVTLTAVNPLYTVYELSHQLKDSNAKYLFTTSELAQTATEAAKRAGCVQKVITVGETAGCTSFESMMRDDASAYPEDVQFNPKEDVVVIPYSSGTTGLPKGVLLTHYNILANMCQIGHPDLIPPPGSQDFERVFLGFLPFFHAYGMIAIMCLGLASGATIVTIPRFHPEKFLQAIEKYKVTILNLVPPIVLFMAKSPLVKKYDLSSLKVVGSGAAPLAKSTEEQFQKRFGGDDLKQGYGMTETTCIIAVPPRKNPKPGSVGKILPNTRLKIVHPETQEMLGPNQRGEVCLQGPQIMKGYLNRPEETKKTLDSDGWLHTGDIGYYDEDQHLWLVDRMKELIKYKGFQVPPAELEALLVTHPSIWDCGVTGIPDQSAGELPRAYIVKQVGATITAQEVHDYVKERATNYKQLRGGIEFISEIPRTQTGKIMRRKLKAMAMKSKL